MVAGSAPLLLELQGRLLRMICDMCGMHFEGLASASRWMTRMGVKDKKALKKLILLDVVTAWWRHSTLPLSDAFMERIAQHLKQ